MPVYDDQKQRGDTDELNSITGISPAEEAKMDNSAHSGAADDIAQREGLYNPKKDTDTKSPASKEDLAGKEKSAGGGAGAALGTLKALNPANPASILSAASLITRAKNNKKGLAGIAVGTGVTGLLVTGFLMLLPLKTLSIVNNLQSTFFSASDDAASRMSDNLVRHYIIKKLVPGMVQGRCTSTLATQSCANVTGSNVVSALYTAWHDNNLEGKLARNYGIEIINRNGQIFMRVPSVNGELDLGTYDPANVRTFEGRAFAAMDRAEVRAQIRLAVENESFSRRMRFKYSVGKLLERKYGIRRCVIACTTRDNIQTARETKVRAVKAYLTERILTPRSEAMGLALECSLASFDCATYADNNADEDGQRRTRYETDLQTRLQNYRSRFGTNSLTDLDAEAENIRKKGFVEYAVRRIAGETVGSAVGKIGGKVIPIVGWVDLGSVVVSSAAKAGPALRHMNYVMNSTAMVSLFAMYRTSADEIKTGNVDPTIVGSLASSFDANPANDQGGGAADSTPIYSAIMDGQTNQNTALLDAFLPSAYAASDTVTPYKCDDGNPVPAGEKVCPEVSFSAQSSSGKVADRIAGYFDNPAGTILVGLADIWTTAINEIIKALGIDSLLQFIGEQTPEVIKKIIAWIGDKVMTELFINPVTEKMSGGRTFEMIAGGAAVAGAEVAQNAQGGRVVSDEYLAAIQSRQYAERVAEFESMPMYARIFDGNNSMSLVSRVAVSLPTSRVSGLETVSSIISNPLKSVGETFGSLLSGKTANAAVYVSPRVFGVTPHGYPEKDPVLDGDPEVYWDEKDCDNPDNKKNWGNTATIDDLTQQPIHNQTNGCMLLRSEIANNGAVFDTDLLEPDPTTVAAAPPPSPTDPTDVFGPSDTMTCAAGTDGGVQDGYRDGTLVKIRVCIIKGIDVNAKIAANVDALIKAAAAQGINYTGGSGFRTMAEQTRLYNQNCNNGRCSPRTARPGFSNHQMGLAIDFQYNGSTICFAGNLSAAQCRSRNNNAGFKWLDANAATYKLMSYPAEAWHWSVDGT